MSNPQRSLDARAALGLIQLAASMDYSQMGYWADLAYDQGEESRFKLQRIMATQTPEICERLRAWAETYHV